MPLRWAIPAAAALLLTGLAEARAQIAVPPQAQIATPPQQQMAAPPQEKPPCFDQFMPLRQEVDKRFTAAKSGLDRKASPAELCRLLTRFTEAENAMIKYVEQNAVWCSFPPSAVQNMKAGQSQSAEYRKQACTAASQVQQQQQRPPPGPSLSDAFSNPVPSESTTSTGRGTLDSLGGNPLAR